ncbi:branched-chain amino acid transport system II carrier protein [Clostridium sp. MCC353]|uniref:branched-chain amino acid transport system II carrier protein n=1 Tax=Clostridium sp. MCC353 TaxID=2592646 RepID=UPI001C02B7A7|nr:branched-chain amino acid transport system II carrier protein [Clostridium sp. MCC353]MBT9779925.1 branched-chain amino acid transport system II carrier protein [Clostridium sp. MCC353]
MDHLIIGLTLFSMFFGAGNLIFPPFLGAQAGIHTWTAMTGFALSAVGFPVLGVVAVARSGGLQKLAGRVGPRFAYIFTLLIYLSIGPCLAIPRTASTSFEMAVVPFSAAGAPVRLFQLMYSILFFGIALMLALRPDKLSDRLGKILTPCLLILISVIFAGCIVKPAGYYAPPVRAYASNPFAKGFLDGYQTMDTIAALNFGIIIALNIRARGIVQEKRVIGETVLAGGIAGVLLILVYAALAHIGAMSGGAFEAAENGAGTLNQMVGFEFGNAGAVILAAIFFIACLNTCVGLLSCCSKYFCTIVPRISYRIWVFIFAGISLVISNAGLNRILEVSVPVLNAVYPAAIVLILLALTHHVWEGFCFVYPAAVLFTGIASIGAVLDQIGVLPSLLSGILKMLPFYEAGLEWILPAVFGILAGIVLSGRKNKKVAI